MGSLVLVMVLVIQPWLIDLGVFASKPIEENINTSWYQIPSVGLYKPLIDEKTGKYIRSGFRSASNGETKDIRDQKSPSLELSFSDTGDESFLDKKTIKHSISDLSSLSKAKKLANGRMLSCNAIQDGPKMYFPTCPGDLVIITIAGSMKMTCGEIERRVFYGPVTIKTTNCQQSFIFDMHCEKKQALSIMDPSCNNTGYQTAIIVVSTLLGLSITVIILISLWFVGIRRGVDLNGRHAKMTRNGCFYELSYSEYITGEGKKDFLLEDDPSNINMNHKLLRKHWLILLLTFVICRPIKVDCYELMETYDSTILKYNYKITMGDSEIIDFGSDRITREAVIHTSTLTEMFTTAKWNLDTREEYFCQWYKCEAISVCGMGMLPFIKVGPLAQELFGFRNQNNSYYTCQKLQNLCVFGNGCKLVAFEIVVDSQEIYSVHSMGIGGSHGGEIKPPTGCIVDSVIDKSSGTLDNHLLLSNYKGKSFLCHRDLFSAKPELGMLGDLQMTQDGNYHFATNEVRCVADHNDRAICRYGSPFIASVRTLCEEVGKTFFKLSVDIPGKIISWKQSGEAVVSMKCDRKLPLKTSSDSCTMIDIRVWEVAHLDTHLLLGFRATSINRMGSFKFPRLVHMNGHSFLCNGEPQFTELYDLKSLKSLGINYTMNSIPYNSLDPIQEDHFSNHDPEDARGITTFDKVVKSIPFLGLSTTSIVILVILIILCLKR